MGLFIRLDVAEKLRLLYNLLLPISPSSQVEVPFIEILPPPPFFKAAI